MVAEEQLQPAMVRPHLRQRNSRWNVMVIIGRCNIHADRLYSVSEREIVKFCRVVDGYRRLKLARQGPSVVWVGSRPHEFLPPSSARVGVLPAPSPAPNRFTNPFTIRGHMTEPGTESQPRKTQTYTFVTYEYLFKSGAEWAITLTEGKDTVKEIEPGVMQFYVLELDKTTEVNLWDTAKRSRWTSVVELPMLETCRECKRFAIADQGVCKFHGGQFVPTNEVVKTERDRNRYVRTPSTR